MAAFAMADRLKAMAKDQLVKVTGTELEKKIAEACSNKPWGASTTMLSEIAQATYDYQEYPVVMASVWKRINESGRNWRIVYKGTRAARARRSRRRSALFPRNSALRH